MPKLKIIIVFTTFLLTSCLARYRPVPDHNIEVSGDFAMLKLDTETIAVTEAIWGIEPQYLNNSFTTMYVKIQNKSTESITIDPINFTIIDSDKYQYDLYPAELVLEMMLTDPSLIPDRFAIAPETQRENLARRNNIRNNIIAESFSFGDIYPGAIKEGFLFFKKLENSNKEFMFIYKNNEIVFRKS